MGSLQDMYGRRVRLQRIQVDTPGLLPIGTYATKLTLVDEETGKELAEPFDVISHVLVPQADGTYIISRLVESDKREMIEAPEENT